MQDYRDPQGQNNNQYQSDGEIPRWNPSPNDYNTPPKAPQNKTPKRRWLIPLIIVAAVMVISIVVGVVIGLNRIRKEAALERSQKQAEKVIDVQEDASEEETKIEALPQTNAVASGYVITDVSGIVQEVMPSVVSITSRTLVNTANGYDYFNFFFGGWGNGNDNSGEKTEVESGLGSGTIISQNETELLILTSYHVVEGCSSLFVTFADDNSVDGYVKAASAETDIAIVAVPLAEIQTDTMSAIKTAKLSKESANVGEGVIVIGNALGYGMSVTTGIVSAVDRTITVDGKTITVIQTDAAINSGNSGGCMLNAKGEVIGISEAKIVISSVEGMCYAIPVDINSALIQELLTTESTGGGVAADETQGAYLGIRGRDISATNAEKYDMPQGIYVAATIRGGGAEAAGIQEGDIIIAIDDVSTLTMSQLQAQLAKYNPGDVAQLSIMRDYGYGYENLVIDVVLTDILS
ncbi:MAG: trypsin-like peptidase domain-containing protein [Lachnospiraceae bacterium]|nr:trypsin-like peptidase domain-containing protein [Lachnospiraceae bacterium]